MRYVHFYLNSKDDGLMLTVASHQVPNNLLDWHKHHVPFARKWSNWVSSMNSEHNFGLENMKCVDVILTTDIQLTIIDSKIFREHYTCEYSFIIRSIASKWWNARKYCSRKLHETEKWLITIECISEPLLTDFMHNLFRNLCVA